MSPPTIVLPRVLPHVPKLHGDELLSSWFHRITTYYGVSLDGFIGEETLDRIGISRFDAGLLDVDPPPELLVQLSIFTNRSPDALLSHTLRWQHLGWPLEWFAGMSWEENGRAWRATSFPTFCRRCQEDMVRQHGEAYVRQDWALAWTTMCPIHEVPLGYLPAGPDQVIGSEDLEMTRQPRPWREGSPLSVIGWHRLTAFERALKDAMDGRGLPSDFGGPASPSELKYLLGDLIDRWGEAWGDRYSVLEWITPNLFAPPSRWAQTVTREGFGWLLPLQRRWFVAALMATMSDEAWWKMMDSRDVRFFGKNHEIYRALLQCHPKSAHRTERTNDAVDVWPPRIRDGVRRLLQADRARDEEYRFRQTLRKREQYEQRRAVLNARRSEAKRSAAHAARHKG